MSTLVRLDRNRMAELEPSEGDEREQYMLSPFSVPRVMHVEMGPAGVHALRLGYIGDDLRAETEALDDGAEHKVAVGVSKVGRKVVELRFSHPIKAAAIPAIADRLERAASRLHSAAERLSYRMTAQVLRSILTPIVSEFEDRPRE